MEEQGGWKGLEWRVGGWLGGELEKEYIRLVEGWKGPLIGPFYDCNQHCSRVTSFELDTRISLSRSLHDIRQVYNHAGLPAIRKILLASKQNPVAGTD